MPGFLLAGRYALGMATVNAGAYPPDYSTAVGRVRLLTSDTEPRTVAGDPPDAQQEYVWQGDAEITALIDLTGSPERAALRILRLVAMTPAMQLKKWSSADLSVDGAQITRALRDLINDIEDEIEKTEGGLASEFVAIVPVGPAMGQPAFYPRHPLTYRGEEIDPTLPIVAV